MNIIRTIKHLRLIVLALLTLTLVSFDLPVKTVNGRQYFYYTVKKGDTLYSLATSLGVTRKQIVEYNPAAADMLKDGDILYFPADKFNTTFTPLESAETVPAQTSDGLPAYHKVKKGETLYGISRQYNISQDRILELNPEARNGIKTGAILKIAHTPEAAVTPEDEAAPAAPVLQSDDNGGKSSMIATLIEDTAELSPVIVNISSEAYPTAPDENADDTITLDNETAGTPSIAILLPFMLNDETPSRQAMLYTDFYKGLLLAADTLSHRGDSIAVYVYDTEGSEARLRQLLDEPSVKDASVIIAPESAGMLSLLSSGIQDSHCKIINVFNIKDSLYLTDSRFIQVNTPHDIMYAAAADAIDRLYGNYTPIMLRSAGGRNEKVEFAELVRNRYAAKGITPIDYAYDDALLSGELDNIDLSDGKSYVVIPSSGNLNEFNKFIHAVLTLRTRAENPAQVAIFGYPDWTAFRGDAKELLHAADATVYSRFYLNPDNFDTGSLRQAYDKWYGTEMIDVIPNQAILGFDTGNMIIRNLRANDGRLSPDDIDYRGIQSSFKFANHGSGYCNEAVYIIRFNPDGTTQRLQ